MSKSVFDYICDGQISISEYLAERDSIIYDLDIRGLCDDPYCPKCGYAFWTYGPNNEIDCERCPKCKIRVKWDGWHRANDDE